MLLLWLGVELVLATAMAFPRKLDDGSTHVDANIVQVYSYMRKVDMLLLGSVVTIPALVYMDWYVTPYLTGSGVGTQLKNFVGTLLK